MVNRCDLCGREFQNSKSLSNHKRWHNLPQYKEYQERFRESRKNTKHTQETKNKISLSLMGDKNPGWKGNDVSYSALHTWIRRRYPKPQKCENCDENAPYDLANISQQYKRDLSDWEYLCRYCHMNKDGRFEKFVEMARQPTVHSEESKRKMSISRKGKRLWDTRKHPWLGRCHSQRTIKKMRESAILREKKKRENRGYE